MQITPGKILSLMIAVGYAIFAFDRGGMAGLKWCAVFLFPMAFIWFPEEIGSVTGYFPTGYVNVQTPAALISAIGWFFLIGAPIVLYAVTKFAT